MDDKKYSETYSFLPLRELIEAKRERRKSLVEEIGRLDRELENAKGILSGVMDASERVLDLDDNILPTSKVVRAWRQKKSIKKCRDCGNDMLARKTTTLCHECRKIIMAKNIEKRKEAV